MPRTASRAGAGALLGEEQPVAGVLERRRALQALDAVVGERALEVRDEALGQALGLGVERAQERVQVLLRAAAAPRRRAVGVRAVERAHVGVDLEQRGARASGSTGAAGTAASARATSSAVTS